MIKGSDEVRRKNRGDDLASGIKEYREKERGSLETVGQEDFLETSDQEDFETVGQEDSAPSAPPRRIQRTVE